MGQMPFLALISRKAMGFNFPASAKTHEGEEASLPFVSAL